MRFNRILSQIKVIGNLIVCSCIYQHNKYLFFNIADPPSRFVNKANELISERKQQLFSLIGNTDFVEDHKLFEPHHILVDSIDKFVSDSNGNIIVDISSLPKRFFFPIIDICLWDAKRKIKT